MGNPDRTPWTEIELLRRQVCLLTERVNQLQGQPLNRTTAAMPAAPLYRMGDELDPGQAAELLGVSRRYFVDELSKKPGFPKPSTNLSNKTRKWRYADLLRVKVPKRR